MEIFGKVIEVLPIESGVSKNGNEWKRATVVVEIADNSQYPRSICMKNLKRADEFASLQCGTYGKFFIDVESHKLPTNGRWVTDVSCWKWEVGQQPQQMAQPMAQPQAPQGYAPQQPQQQYAQPYQQPAPQQQYAPQGGFPQQPQADGDIPF